jgi:hypothetical protein
LNTFYKRIIKEDEETESKMENNIEKNIEKNTEILKRTE